MTLEEVLGRVTSPEDKAFLSKMISDQNSYITKLETQLKEKASNPAAAGLDPTTAKYLEKNMRRDVISEASEKIIEAVGKEVFDAIKPDYEAFLTSNMDKAHTTVEFAVDAFNLVYGRCLAKKDHPIHNIGKGGANPTATPTPIEAGTNSQSVATVQNILAGQPPVMTGKDSNAGTGIPGTQGEPVKNTRDAFARFKNRVNSAGGGRFQ